MSEGYFKLNEGSRSISNEDIKKLLELLENIRFGSITLVIQNNKVVQIEKNEKVRLK